MQAQIKKTIKAGNSSAVVLPRAWLDREVRVELVEKTPEGILCDLIKILEKNIPLNSIIGVYLVGSYARGEPDESSDIDILVITNGIDKEIIREGIYNILIVSYQLVNQKLRQDLFPIGQMLREAKPLLNSDYIEDLEIKVTKKNVKWYLDTTKEKLELIKKYIDYAKDKNKKYLSDKITYTLVLRIRTIEIIKKIIKNKNYMRKDFVKLIEKVSRGKNAYERYLAVKNDLEDKEGISLEGVERLWEYLKGDLGEVRGMVVGR